MPSRDHHFPCKLTWTGASRGPTTSYDAYDRALRVDIPGKPSLEASAAPPFRGDASRHNPEDLLVASLSACHCLSYLALAARAGIVVIAYEDDAIGTMAFLDRKLRFTDVLLRPQVRVRPGADLAKARSLHEQAHQECFIANSVNFPVRHEPTVEE